MSKLGQAKEKLSTALNDLELAILNKLNQAKLVAVANSTMTEGDREMMHNLYNEINSLQKSLAELGAENEALRTANQELEALKITTKETVDHIKIDLSKIKTILNQS